MFLLLFRDDWNLDVGDDIRLRTQENRANRSMPKITLVRSFLGVAGKSSCTENDYALVQSCMFFFPTRKLSVFSVFGDLYFAALNMLVYLME